MKFHQDKDFSDYYSKYYNDFLYGKHMAGFVMRKNHVLLENSLNKNDYFSQVLEIGGNCGQHVPYIQHRYDNYVITEYDTKIVESIQKSKKLPNKVSIQQADMLNLPFAENSFDRVIASHVLEHVFPPDAALKEMARVTKKGGIISIALPCDPGIAWRLGRFLTTRRKAKKQGFVDNVTEYDYLLAKEHVNHITGLLSFINYYFNNIKSTYWPLRLPLTDVNLLYICHIKL